MSDVDLNDQGRLTRTIHCDRCGHHPSRPSLVPTLDTLHTHEMPMERGNKNMKVQFLRWTEGEPHAEFKHWTLIIGRLTLEVTWDAMP